MRKYVPLIAILLFAGMLILALLNGYSHFARKYQVTYDWKEAYKGAKDFYRAGTRVKLTYCYIASDTDYRFIVTGQDGSPVSQEPAYNGDIIFIMPEQNVKVEAFSRNTMEKGSVFP